MARVTTPQRPTRSAQRLLTTLALLAFATGAAAQTPPQAAVPALTAADYARAERFMPYNAVPLVLRNGVRATWLPDDRFWYRTLTEQGSQAILVDPATATKAPCELPPCLEPAPLPGRPAPRTPAFLAAALRARPRAAAAFKALRPSHRREYIEWLTGAKTRETRDRRLATVLEWISAGKPRYWKHQR